MTSLCASGSVGGARPCQGRGRGFESRLALFLFAAESLDFTGLKIPRDYLRAKGGSRLCNFYRENRRLQTPVFQYDFSRADADILRMAGNGAAKPDRE